jgi:hypothetical protein
MTDPDYDAWIPDVDSALLEELRINIRDAIRADMKLWAQRGE